MPPLPGPEITYFGITTADNHVIPAEPEPDAQGRPIYTRLFGAGFFLVIEARAGDSNSPPDTREFYTPSDPASRPDVQILASNDLGISLRRKSALLILFAPGRAAQISLALFLRCADTMKDRHRDDLVVTLEPDATNAHRGTALEFTHVGRQEPDRLAVPGREEDVVVLG